MERGRAWNEVVAGTSRSKSLALPIRVDTVSYKRYKTYVVNSEFTQSCLGKKNIYILSNCILTRDGLSVQAP